MVSASIPDPPAITGRWEDELERRIKALQAKYGTDVLPDAPPPKPTGGRALGERLPNGVPAALQERVAKLGVTILRFHLPTHTAVVRCPHCGGDRDVQENTLNSWAKVGRASGCVGSGTTMRGARCRPATSAPPPEGEPDDE